MAMATSCLFSLTYLRCVSLVQMALVHDLAECIVGDLAPSGIISII